MLWLLLVLLLGLGTGVADAVCGGTSPTRTAASAARTDVNECVTAAVDGDTIMIPAGTATWTTPIPLPNTKDLIIIGATTVSCTGTPVTCSATDLTTLTCGAFCFVFAAPRTQRVSGLTMTVDGGFLLVGNQATPKHFRLDHTHILGTDSFTQLWFAGDSNAVHPQGVVDNNLFEDIAVRAIGTTHQWDDTCGTCQNQLWAQPIALGGGDARVFIEHNEFRHDLSGVQSSDSSYGGRYVFRFNHTTSGFHNSEVHGMQGENRGSQLTEIYHNTFTSVEAGGTGGTTNFRGGTGVIFQNTQSFPFSYGVEFTIDRSEYDEPAGNFGTVHECGVGGADGNSPTGVDQQTEGQNGWRCRDQVGTWYDAVPWTFTGSGTAPFGTWQQVLAPVYVWGNTTGGSPMTIGINTQGDIETKIVVSREFYCDAGSSIGSCANGVRSGTVSARPSTCTTGMAYWATDEGEWNSLAPGADGRLYRCVSPNTWALYYTPYLYPHPWTGAVITLETAPVIIRVTRPTP